MNGGAGSARQGRGDLHLDQGRQGGSQRLAAGGGAEPACYRGGPFNTSHTLWEASGGSD